MFQFCGLMWMLELNAMSELELVLMACDGL